MTVKEIKKELENQPDDMQVFLGPRLTEFAYGLANSVISKEIRFSEDPDGAPEYDGPESRDTVIIICED